MGLFDSLFGGGKQQEAPKARPKKEKAVAQGAADQGVPPEVIAAICASVSVIMDEDDAMVAAVVAAIVHARSGGLAVRIRRTANAWGATGRQKLMDSRQF